MYLMMYFQSDSVCLSAGVRVMNNGLNRMACWIGEKSARPEGRPKDACCNFPANFSYFANDVRVCFSIFEMRVMMLVHFLSGS